MESAPKELQEDNSPTLIILYFQGQAPVVAWWNEYGGDWPKRGDWAIDSPKEKQSYPPREEPIGWTHLPIKWNYLTRLEKPVGSSEPAELT
jgi:hypothetical protein